MVALHDGRPAQSLHLNPINLVWDGLDIKKKTYLWEHLQH